MKKILITGAGSYIGTKVEEWLKRTPELFEMDAMDYHARSLEEGGFQPV